MGRVSLGGGRVRQDRAVPVVDSTRRPFGMTREGPGRQGESGEDGEDGEREMAVVVCGLKPPGSARMNGDA